MTYRTKTYIAADWGQDEDAVNQLHKWNNTLPDIGIRMKTGLTVDFRNRDILRDEDEDGAIPLFYSQHIKHGTVQFPIKKEPKIRLFFS